MGHQPKTSFEALHLSSSRNQGQNCPATSSHTHHKSQRLKQKPFLVFPFLSPQILGRSPILPLPATSPPSTSRQLPSPGANYDYFSPNLLLSHPHQHLQSHSAHSFGGGELVKIQIKRCAISHEARQGSKMEERLKFRMFNLVEKIDSNQTEACVPFHARPCFCSLLQDAALW